MNPKDVISSSSDLVSIVFVAIKTWNSSRKAADFDVTQRISIAVSADDALAAALAAHMEHIKNETLALEVSIAAGSGDVDINGHMTSIEVKAV